MPEPEYRRSLVRAIRQQFVEDGIEAEVLARLPEHLREHALSTDRSGWVPAELIIEIDKALVGQFGEEGLIDFWKRFGSRARNIPVLGAMAEGLTRVFAGPHGILKLMPRSFSAVGRHNGVIEAQLDDDKLGGRLGYRDVPAILSHRYFVLANEGSLLGAFALIGTNPTMRSEMQDLDDGRFVIHMRWAPEDLADD